MRAGCVVALIVGLSGCASDGPSTETPGPEAPEPPAPLASFALPNNGTGCTEVSVFALRGQSDLQPLVPPGFTVADARDFLPLPLAPPTAPTGQGVVAVTAVRCAASEIAPEGYGEGAVAIFVNAPNVEGVAAAPTNMYELGRATPDGPHARLLERVGWARSGDEVSNTFSVSPVAAGVGEALLEGARLYLYSSEGPPATVPFEFDIRWWHAAPSGLAYFNYDFAVDGYLGPATCEFAPDSLAARAMGGTSCPDENFVGMVSDFGFVGEFRYLAGAGATSS